MSSRFNRWYSWPLLSRIPWAARTALLWCFMIGLFQVLVSTISYIVVQPVVPIFYSLALPAQHLAAKEWLFLFPGLSFITTFLQLGVLTYSSGQEPLIIRLFSWTTFGLQVILTLALLRVLYIIW